MLTQDIIHALMRLQEDKRAAERRRERAQPELASMREVARRDRTERTYEILDVASRICAWRDALLASSDFTLFNMAFGADGRIPIFEASYWHGLPIRPNPIAKTVVTLDGPERAWRFEDVKGGEVWERSAAMTRCGELYDAVHPALLHELDVHLHVSDPWRLAKAEIARLSERYQPVR